MSKYAIGIDFGTESGRAVLVRLKDGKEICEHVTYYCHGVISEYLPHKNIKLDYEWALQDPSDYLGVLKISIPSILKKSNVDVEHIIAIGIDFTSSTILPIDRNGNPLCFDSEWKDNPHSWVKLWKHHAAQPYANKLNEVAKKRNESFLNRYGGKISSEWMIPKICETLMEAPDVYDATYQFVEATDWIVLQLTGKLKRNNCSAGYKSIWHKQQGYPSKDFFSELNPKLESLIETKLKGEVYSIGSKAGYLTRKMANLLGLSTKTVVAVGNVDAHVSVPGIGVAESGKMVMTMGTSICHLLLDKKEIEINGICGVVKDGIVPGFYGYEAGQPAVGDVFAWFVKNFVPKWFVEKARNLNMSIYDFLEYKASFLYPGETGLIALDWWNGNRSTLIDSDVSGVIIGMTLQTKPEEIYRALLESTAFGTKKIIDTFEQNSLNVDEIYACGGLSQKNELLMQIYADITNKKISVTNTLHTSALGSAMYGAVAAGKEKGGYANISEAVQNMSNTQMKVYYPNEENVYHYSKLYEQYKALYDYFGRKNEVMKNLKYTRDSSIF